MEGDERTLTHDVIEGIGARRTSRKRFLAEAAGLTGAILAAGVGGSQAAAADASSGGRATAASTRGFTAGKFGLELNTGLVGLVSEVAGGGIHADVIDETATSTFVPKHLGLPRFEEFAVKIGLGMSAEVYDWIRDAWNATLRLKNGAIVTADFNFNVKARREFDSGFITSVRMPELDAASKDTASMTVKFVGVRYQDVMGSGTLKASTSLAPKWIAGDFRLDLAGVDTTKVAKVESFTVDQGITDLSKEVSPNEVVIGDITPAFTLGYAPIDFPNVVVTFARSTAATWRAWHVDMVVNGNPSEKKGTLSYLDPLGKELFHIDLHNVGIFDLVDLPSAAGETTLRTQARLYVERMTVDFGRFGGKPPAP
jgi:hypothetical protein